MTQGQATPGAGAPTSVRRDGERFSTKSFTGAHTVKVALFDLDEESTVCLLAHEGPCSWTHHMTALQARQLAMQLLVVASEADDMPPAEVMRDLQTIQADLVGALPLPWPVEQLS